mmetsp:Transcript_14546/g.21454  ORF Transcript_14546/g.21454 Transcript_14546/m.21454 type:complete len:217 (-) Transcript_14546:110-760(-)|eukprot:CAMPEP_0195518426 /NCGR_PEP_ID=MMETSP0794_2-20130614/12872_1 /TAXON_ID=515487 /ORGANISM="Stephanopyxis turris, Strain CCMP 815" /LENGTH=216 /DNA_ID=CAMNT_0040647381 /DNA_START=65 /DNA_END=715 /DNA_ORIENTATION=+
MKITLSFLLIAFTPLASGDSCENINANAAALYNSTECAFAKVIIMEGNLFAGPSPPLEVCNGSCVDDVHRVVSEIIDEVCAVTGEGIAGFIYPVHDYSANFTAITDFYCLPGNCYDLLKNAPSSCGMDNVNNNSLPADCFENVPCDCLDDFLVAVENASDFQEDYGIDTKIVDAVRVAAENTICLDESSSARGAGTTAAAAVAVLISHFLVYNVAL